MILLDCTSEFYGILVAVLGVLVAILLVGQITQVLTLERRIKSIKKEQAFTSGLLYFSLSFQFWYHFKNKNSEIEAIGKSIEYFILINDNDRIKLCREQFEYYQTHNPE